MPDTSPLSSSSLSFDDNGNPVDYISPHDDKIKEECGVFGIFGMDNAASLTALGMHALQPAGKRLAA